jgi:adenine nucleotide transporter 17
MTTKASDSVTPVALGAMEELVIGILTGVTSKGITLPVSAVCVRQQLGAHDEDDDVSHHLSLIETLRAIHREEGLSGLFSALPPTIPLALLPSLTLSIHSILLRLLIPARHRAHPPGSLTFFLGALSNALATIPLYPLVLVKALSQSGHHNKEEEGSGMIGTLNRILGKEGIEGLYKGIEGQLAKGVLQQGVMMLVKQRCVAVDRIQHS